MKDTLFEFAEAILKGRDLLKKVESSGQACAEAESRLKKLAEKESEGAANLAKAEKQAKRIVDGLLEQAEKKASGVIQDAEERAESGRKGVADSLDETRATIDSLASTKSELVKGITDLRADVSSLTGQRDQLLSAVTELRNRLSSV